MIIDRATPATQNGHDKSIRYRPSHDSNLQQAQTFVLLKYIQYYFCILKCRITLCICMLHILENAQRHLVPNKLSTSLVPLKCPNSCCIPASLLPNIISSLKMPQICPAARANGGAPRSSHLSPRSHGCTCDFLRARAWLH